jgi:hypothetical protein
MNQQAKGRGSGTLLTAALAVVALVAVGSSSEEARRGGARLEFRILANQHDDAEALEAAKKDLAASREEQEKRARDGLPPAPVKKATDRAPGYSWVEVASAELRSLNLDNAAETDAERNVWWKRAAAARVKGETLVLRSQGECLFSRTCTSIKLSEEERKRKKYDYFLLTRDPQPGKAVTGEHMVRVKVTEAELGNPCLEFTLDKRGGELFFELTSANLPSPDDEFHRLLAIIFDGTIVAAPRLNQAIRQEGQITGRFTQAEAEAMARVLRGAPAEEKK